MCIINIGAIFKNSPVAKDVCVHLKYKSIATCSSLFLTDVESKMMHSEISRIYVIFTTFICLFFSRGIIKFNYHVQTIIVQGVEDLCFIYEQFNRLQVFKIKIEFPMRINSHTFIYVFVFKLKMKS